MLGDATLGQTPHPNASAGWARGWGGKPTRRNSRTVCEPEPPGLIMLWSRACATVTPGFSVQNSCNCGMVNAECRSDFSVRPRRQTDFGHLFRRESSCSRVKATLPRTISHIVGLGSDKEMRRIAASAIVTTVTDEKTFRDRPYVDLVRQSMRFVSFTGDREASITVAIRSRRPVPARIRAARFVGPSPEAARNIRDGSRPLAHLLQTFCNLMRAGKGGAQQFARRHKHSTANLCKARAIQGVASQPKGGEHGRRQSVRVGRCLAVGAICTKTGQARRRALQGRVVRERARRARILAGQCGGDCRAFGAGSRNGADAGVRAAISGLGLPVVRALRSGRVGHSAASTDCAGGVSSSSRCRSNPTGPSASPRASRRETVD